MAEMQIKPHCKQSKIVSSPQLPIEVICDILKRLPAKSLMRFKCVCKEWLKTIRDPLFAQLHRSHSYTRPEAFTLEFFSLKCFPPDHFPCSNVVNGIVCLHLIFRKHISLFNLTTKEEIDLPTITNRGDYDSYAIGFDPFSNQYKVLHFSNDVFGSNLGLEILTLGSKSPWIKHAGFTPVQFFRGIFHAICVGERIYFNDAEVYGKKRIQFFYLTKGKFGTIVVPEGFLQARNMLPTLVEVEGNLGLVTEENRLLFITVRIWIFDRNRCNWVEKDICMDGISPKLQLWSFEGRLDFYKMTGTSYNSCVGYIDPIIYVHVENIYPLSSSE